MKKECEENIASKSNYSTIPPKIREKKTAKGVEMRAGIWLTHQMGPLCGKINSGECKMCASERRACPNPLSSQRHYKQAWINQRPPAGTVNG